MSLGVVTGSLGVVIGSVVTLGKVTVSFGMVTVPVVTLGMVTVSVVTHGGGHSARGRGHSVHWDDHSVCGHSGDGHNVRALTWDSSQRPWSHEGLVTVSVGMVTGSVVTPGGGHSVSGTGHSTPGGGHSVHGVVTVPLGVVTLSLGVVTLSVLTRGIVHSVRGIVHSVRAPSWGSSHPRCQQRLQGAAVPPGRALSSFSSRRSQLRSISPGKCRERLRGERPRGPGEGGDEERARSRLRRLEAASRFFGARLFPLPAP